MDCVLVKNVRDHALIMRGAAALQVTKAAQRFAVRVSATEQNVDVEEVVKDLQEKVSFGVRKH